MDFITKLLDSKAPITGKIYNSIWVDIYRFTCFTILAPMLKEYNKNYMASLFVQKHAIYFGIPEIIITDRDTIFISKYQQTILSSLGTKLKLSTAYYPETDRQIERMNQIIQNYLRIYINTNYSNWVQLLPLAQMAINNRIIISTKQILQNYLFRFSLIPYKLILFKLPSEAGLQKAKKLDFNPGINTVNKGTLAKKGGQSLFINQKSQNPSTKQKIRQQKGRPLYY